MLTHFGRLFNKEHISQPNESEIGINLDSTNDMTNYQPMESPSDARSNNFIHQLLNSERWNQAWRRSKYVFKEGSIGAGYGGVIGLIGGTILTGFYEKNNIRFYCNYIRYYCESYQCTFVSCSSVDNLLLNCSLNNETSTDRNDYPSSLLDSAESSTKTRRLNEALSICGTLTIGGAILGGLIRGGIALFKDIPEEKKSNTTSLSHSAQEQKVTLRF